MVALSEVNVKILSILAPRKSTVTIFANAGACAGGIVVIVTGAGVGSEAGGNDSDGACAGGIVVMATGAGVGSGTCGDGVVGSGTSTGGEVVVGAGTGSRLELIARNRDQKSFCSSFSAIISKVSCSAPSTGVTDVAVANLISSAVLRFRNLEKFLDDATSTQGNTTNTRKNKVLWRIMVTVYDLSVCCVLFTLPHLLGMQIFRCFA